ncbi:hypothetical protein RGI92_000456 [Serratia marcescens]
MSDKEIEQEIQAKGKTAPRVTPDHIESIIASEHFFTAAQGYDKSAAENFHDDPYPLATPDALHLLTFCVLVLRNGFTVTGESACASPENFDAEIGMQIARANAVQKIWMLEGYLLKQRMHDDAHLRELLRQKE